MHWKQILLIVILAPLLVITIMGSLFFGLVFYSDYTATHPKGEKTHMECPEGKNSYLCIIRNYLKPPPLQPDI